MSTNVLSHSINNRGLAVRGAEVGLVSAVLMGLIATFASPAVNSGLDIWSFPRAVSTIILGSGAAHPLTGFDAAPVLVGFALHLFIGAVFGAIYALIVGFFAIDEPAPIILGALAYGAIVFIGSYAIVGGIVFPALSKIPMVIVFWSHLMFGLVAGLMLATWPAKFDDGLKVRERVRERKHLPNYWP